MTKLLIFDFDGTIADTKNLYYSSIHKWLKRQNIHFSEEKFKELFGLKLSEILKRMKVRKNAEEIKRRVHDDVFKAKIKISSDVKHIKNLNAKKIIVSNTITKNIKNVIVKKKINGFSEIYGGDKFETKDKFIKSYMKKRRLKREEVFYIGDMAKDIGIARRAGCISVSISHKISWDSRKNLLEAGPDMIISSFKELESQPCIVNG